MLFIYEVLLILSCPAKLKTPLLLKTFLKSLVFCDSLWFNSHTAVSQLKEDHTQALLGKNYAL